MSQAFRTAFLAIAVSLFAQGTPPGAAATAERPDLIDPTLSNERPSDAWITAATRLALVRAQAVEGWAIGSDVEDGVLLLHGMVSSKPEKTRAVAVAGRVPGVREIRDVLRVVPPEEQEDVAFTDALVAGRVALALSHDSDLWDRPLEVHAVDDGVAILGGHVGSPELHERALETAEGVEGVRHVVSLLHSSDPERDAELWNRTAPAARIDDPSRLRSALSDAWVQTRVKLELLLDPGLSPTATDVDTSDGVVTLFGSVESAEVRERALARALSVDGVLFVDNDLQVVPESVAETVKAVDEDLQREVERRIDSEEFEDADISVAVENATVRLKGSVPTHRDRMKAVLVAFSTEGVRDVSDGLRVVSRRS